MVAWSAKNLPIPPEATPREIHYRMALHELVLGDLNSCARAAAANSLKWLMNAHPELPDIDSLRELLDLQ